MKKSGIRPLIFFALFWSAITLSFDVVEVKDALARLASLRFQPVPCTILESKVTESSDGEGTSYRADINFSYSVEGRDFESDRVYAGSKSGGGSGRARRLVNLYPGGSQTNAYYNPNDPGFAVLRRGFRGNELFMALFMTPFNLVMIGLWAWGIYARRVLKHPPLAGGAKIIETKEGKRVRLPSFPPALAAGVTLGGVCFVSIFIVMFTKGEYAPLPLVGLVWIIAIGAALWACVWRVKRARSGCEDLVLHADRKRVTLPQTCGRKTGVLVEREEIAGLDVHLEYDSYKRPSRFVPTLVMKNGERLPVTQWTDERLADSFNEWLRGELQLPPPKLVAKPA